MTKTLFLIVSALFILTACSPKNAENAEIDTYFERYEIYKTNLNKYERTQNEQEQEQYLLKAIEAAENIKWTTGIIFAKSKLGGDYSTRRECDKAERLFKEIKDSCDSGNCTPQQLAINYDYQFLVAVDCRKDSAQAFTIAEQVIKESNLEPAAEMSERLNGYAEMFETYKLPQEAEKLRRQVRNLSGNSD